MEIVKLFATLAEIDSPSGEEKEVANYIRKYLRDLGYNPETDNSGNIYCRIGNSINPKLFCAHMDTVEPGRGIKVSESNGFLVSDGTTILGADNKVSLTAILHSIYTLKDQKLNLELVFSVREETNSGVSEINKNLIESKVGFVFDGGDGELGWLVAEAPTIQDFMITIEGRSSHASSPETGIDALKVLMNAYPDLTTGRLDENTTFNIGLIDGGTSTNTTPAKLVLKGDLRSKTLIDFNLHKENIESSLRKSASMLGAELHFNWIPYSIGYEMSNKTENYKRIKELYSRNNISIINTKTTSGSDAGFLNSIGVETFCLGDGVRGAHTTEETVSLEDLGKLSQIIQSLMLQV